MPDSRRAEFERVLERSAWEPPMGAYRDTGYGQEALMPWGATSSTPARREPEQTPTPDWFNPANSASRHRDPLTGLGVGPGSGHDGEDCVVS